LNLKRRAVNGTADSGVHGVLGEIGESRDLRGFGKSRVSPGIP